jgi:hypothetical protein
MGSEATQFRSGDEWNGNRAGRPVGSLSLTTLIKQVLEGTKLGKAEIPNGRTVAEWFAIAVIRQAIRGNGAYMKEIMERVDGKVPDAKPQPQLSMEAVVDRLREKIAQRQREANPTEAPHSPGPT